PCAASKWRQGVSQVAHLGVAACAKDFQVHGRPPREDRRKDRKHFGKLLDRRDQGYQAKRQPWLSAELLRFPVGEARKRATAAEKDIADFSRIDDVRRMPDDGIIAAHKVRGP